MCDVGRRKDVANGPRIAYLRSEPIRGRMLMIPRRRYEFTDDLRRVLLAGVSAGQLSSGPGVTVLSDMLADTLTCEGRDRPLVRVTGSGRRALLQLLEASGVAPGSAVLLPAYTFAGVAIALRRAGYQVVLADTGRERPIMTPESVQASWTDTVRCVLVTHLFGQVSRTDEIAAFAAQRGAIVIEDCAHSIGCLDGGEPTGRRGLGALLSFDVLKPVAALRGGAAVANDPDTVSAISNLAPEPPASAATLFADAAKGLAEAGLFKGPLAGMMSRVLWSPAAQGLLSRVGKTDPGAVGLSHTHARLAMRQLASLEDRQARRRAMARRLLSALELDEPQLAEAATTRGNAYFLVVAAADGDARKLSQRLRASGCDAGVGSELADNLGTLLKQELPPNALRWWRSAVQLPCGATYSDDEIERLETILSELRGQVRLAV